MEVVFSERFKKDYANLPRETKQALDKALKFFLANPCHPSLRTRKLPNTSIWYTRLTRGYRFTFELYREIAVLRRVGTHPILDKERKIAR